ncbi:MAG: hypothetical protein U9R66_06585 [Thermodesulfobacteriota bacterium]|nr:hypothetical protein [Thermodesulfobacteriota bacterium]
MIKKYVLMAAAAGLLLAPAGAFAKMGSGQMSAKSKDIDVEFFGSQKMYPHFMDNVNFNDDAGDGVLGEENGAMGNNAVRSETRVGWKGTGEDWSFLVTLEADVTMNKTNGDRGEQATGPSYKGASGSSFGLEKLDFRYNFGGVELSTGWNGRFLDINSGGLLYGDDHPFFGITGKSDSFSWEALYLMIQDDITDDRDGIGALNAQEMDWRVYSLRGAFDLGGFTLAPLYAFSDNNDQEAQTHYLGVEGYGKIGIFTPRFEVIYANGEMDEDSSKGIAEDYDIEAWAVYGSVEFDLGKALNPYVGFSWLSGDDDGNDDDIEAFNGITNISRYTSTFGMENAMIYRTVPTLGSVLYSNNFNMLGSQTGYGGIANTSKGDAPGLLMLGMGSKGQLNEKWSYKAQLMYFELDDTGALEDSYGHSIDDEMGYEFDLQLTYVFNNHFSIGNVISIFDPGDAIKDLRGDDYDDTAFLDVIEMTWKF